MSARLRPIDTVDPAELHRVLLWAHARSGSADRTFTAQRVADRVRVSAVDMGVALDALAVVGLLRSHHTRVGLTIYFRHRLVDLGGVEQCRPGTAAISRRELWAAISSAWQRAGAASTDDIAAGLDAPAGRVDRTWLLLRLATWTAAKLLVLTSGPAWALTARGLDQHEQIRRERPNDPQVWAAIAAEQAHRHPHRGLNLGAVADRLGAPTPWLHLWADEAVEAGLLTRTDGGLLPSAGGWRRVDDFVELPPGRDGGAVARAGRAGPGCASGPGPAGAAGVPR
ncbi:hypothetical protein [Frankia gtarii]|uniref:hypothetical protein n=1 Tax=Frankia gtarii TaxID=2950102 RepID=UPI0021BF87A4|nr:hypothetical protein [Frankia gtarii]